MTEMVFGTTPLRAGDPILPRWWRTLDRWSLACVLGLFAVGLLLGLAASVPLHRLATEAEIAACITFLLSPGAAYVTGQCIAIDGGASRNIKVFPLQKHDNSKPYEGFHRAVRPKALDYI